MKKILLMASLLVLPWNVNYAEDVSNGEQVTLKIVEQKSELYNEIQALKNYNGTDNISLLDKIKLKSLLWITNLHMTLANRKITTIKKAPVIINNKNSPKLYSMICDLCKKFDIKVPTLIVFLPEFYSIGVFFNNILVFGGEFTEGLYENELNAVIAHELAHIKCKHIQKTGASVLLASILLELSSHKLMNKLKILEYKTSDSFALKTYKYLVRDNIAACILSPVIIAYFAGLISMVRMNEKEADLKSVEVTGKADDLIQALSFMGGCPCRYREDNSFFAKFKKLFSTHPTIKERIEYLTVARDRMLKDSDLKKSELA